MFLRRQSAAGIRGLRREAVNQQTLAEAAAIVDDVRSRGVEALRHHSARFGDLESGAPLLIGRAEMNAALRAIDPQERACLERVAARIRAFAHAHRQAIRDVDVPVPGGSAGLRHVPVERAGCYAPGGRFPLPSSVLMTVLTARVAGVREVWVASPRPAPVTLAAAAIAGADGFVAAGGAQAIAAFAHGAGEIPAVDAIVGPGNRWVTAAKQLVSSQVAIDMLAGPSELVILADAGASAALVAADLLAQAEHDEDALPILISTSGGLIDDVERELADQLEDLPTAATATAALRNGFAVLTGDVLEGAALCNELAPEHLQLHLRDPDRAMPLLRHQAALFETPHAAEVLGDYGAGGNHVLPTGGTARFTGALSVSTFLRAQTWLRIDDAAASAPLVRDAARMARLEGLEAHARAAEQRLTR